MILNNDVIRRRFGILVDFESTFFLTLNMF